MPGCCGRTQEWFTDDVIPQRFGGEDYWQKDGLWFGNVLSSYGILFNRDALRRLGFVGEPSRWNDLADPRLIGEVGLADPTKSGSVAKAFENILQLHMQRRLGRGASAADTEARAVREGWIDGLRLIQLIGANARYFTDSSQKAPIDVAGDCEAGLCIDFYGRQQQEAVRRRSPEAEQSSDGSERVGYVRRAVRSRRWDPIGLLRGAPHRAAAELFIEYSLAMEGQKTLELQAGCGGRAGALRPAADARAEGFLCARGMEAAPQRPGGKSLRPARPVDLPAGLDPGYFSRDGLRDPRDVPGHARGTGVRLARDQRGAGAGESAGARGAAGTGVRRL